MARPLYGATERSVAPSARGVPLSVVRCRELWRVAVSCAEVVTKPLACRVSLSLYDCVVCALRLAYLFCCIIILLEILVFLRG